ncbi:MAG TPA: right-handed parallel beta-helix repeat-containing protein [Bacteroidota bacterium]|nr:right-handed parallel beta-helix repeat-containing protein [Bacteroidota bacterium]
MIKSVMRLSVFLGLALLAAGCGGTEEQGKSLYVAPAGSDSNPGTMEKPFLTLERARDAIREMTRTAGVPEGGVTVLLRGGTHTREQPFDLRPEDSGEDNAPVVYAAYPGETPVVMGGRRIADWKALSRDIKGMRADLKGRVYVADVSKGWLFHYLYVNGEPQRLSRLYNTDEWFTWPKPVEIGPVGEGGQKFVFREGELNDLEGLDGQIEINLLPVNFWNTLSVLKDIDPSRSTAIRHSRNPTTFWRDSLLEGNYNLLNAVRFIDEPGEWAIDSTAGKVYLLPPKGTIQPEDEIIAPALYRLVSVRGDEENNSIVRHIHFRGIEFRYTDRMPEDVWPEEWIKRQAELPDAMIVVEDAERIVIRDCHFRWSGSYAVDLEKYAQNNAVVYNEMGYVGGGGVLLQGYGPGLKDVNRNNRIAHNHIHHTGTGGYLHSAAVTVYQAGSNDISFNIINHVPYVGIQICGANWDAFNGDPRSNNVDMEDPGGVDAYGKARAQYQTRWQELPKGRASRFTRENFKPYLHSTSNMVHHNVIIDYLEVLSDGAPLYSWSTGMGNLYYDNVMKRRMTSIEGQKWVFAIYMDDNVDGAVVSGNIVWSQTHPGVIFLNKGQNMWSGNVQSFPGKPGGFDSLLTAIVHQGMRDGGWPGSLPEEVQHVVNPVTDNR